MAPKYKLTYFNGRGRAEETRMMFSVAGIEYKDVRVQFEDWKDLKPKTPYGVLPLLEVDGHVYGQSLAIARFAARQCGLAGKNAQEQLMVDSIIDAHADPLNKYVEAKFTQDADKKAEILKQFDEKCNTLFDQLTKIYEANNGAKAFLVGSALSWADLHLFTTIEFFKLTHPDIMKNQAKLQQLLVKIAKLPKIAKHIKDRPETSF